MYFERGKGGDRIFENFLDFLWETIKKKNKETNARSGVL